MGQIEEYGERIRRPLAQGVQYVIDALVMKENVEEVKRIDFQTLRIVRTKEFSDIVLFLVDAYVLGEGAAFEIIKGNPNINAILVLSNWNEYTSRAKELAKSYNIELFTFKELMTAIY